MMRSSILGASIMLNILIQHLPLQSLFWTKIWRAFRASDPSMVNLGVDASERDRGVRQEVMRSASHDTPEGDEFPFPSQFCEFVQCAEEKSAGRKEDRSTGRLEDVR